MKMASQCKICNVPLKASSASCQQKPDLGISKLAPKERH